MAGSVLIQQHLTTPGALGKVVSSPAEDGPADIFSAVLSGLFNGKRGSKIGVPVVAPPNVPPTLPAKSGHELAQTDHAQTGGNNAIKSKSPDMLVKLPEIDTTNSGMAAVVEANKASDEVTEPPIVSPGPLADSRSELACKTQVETISLEPPGMAAKSPATETPQARPRARGKIGKVPDEKTAQIASPPACQNSPVVVLTVPGLPSQQVMSHPTVSMPPPSLGTSDVAVPASGADNLQKVGKPHRVGPLPTGEEPSSRPDHSEVLAAPVPSSGEEALSAKPVLGSVAVSETAMLSVRPDSSQAISSGAQSLSPTQPDQVPPMPAADRATPVDQVAPALVGMLKTTDGLQSITIRMQPAELGEVQIRVDRTVGGVAHVDIITERPETLQLLQRDQPRLEQSLDQAGVLSTGRTISFQIAAPEQIGAGVSRPDGTAVGSGDSGQGQGGSAWRQSSGSRGNADGGPGTNQQQTQARWFRAGLDITA